MIFVPCKDGISHNEIEDAAPDHLEAGCNVLLHAMLRSAGVADMKILIARLNHETNTFSPVPTPLAAFEPHASATMRIGDNKGMRTAMSAFIDLAEARRRRDRDAGVGGGQPERAGRCRGLRRAHASASSLPRAGCDAILLDLHGAMVAENSDDGEGDLLERVRAAAPGVPIGVALDLHGNVTQKMVDNADVIVGFKTYPHIDMYETGEHAGRLLLEMLRGQRRHTVRWKRLPLMSHTLRSTTLSGAMKRAVASARAAEVGGVAAVSVFAGLSLADIEAPCVSVVVTSVDTPEAKVSAQAALDAHRASRSGRRATTSSTAASRWLTRWRAPRQRPSAPTARCCCSTTATTACRAAPATRWTCWKRRWPKA